MNGKLGSNASALGGALLLSLLVVGCGGANGGENHGGDDGGGQHSACSGSVTGSVTATITDCTIWWMESGGQALVGNEDHIDSTADDDNTFSTLGINVITTGDAKTGTLDFANTIAAGASLTLPNGGIYAAQHDTRSTDAPMFGSTTITITSFEPANIPNAWVLHGTARASLEVPPGITSYTGSALLSLTF